MKIEVKKSSVLFIVTALIILSAPQNAVGQGEKKHIREGNREYARNNFQDSEISYRRATEKNKSSADAIFNTGDALYKQKKYDEAGSQFSESSKMINEKAKQSASFYNLGNSLLMSNKISESIEAYKNSLKLDPGNLEAKYNLAYAQDLLKQQQEKQKQQQQGQDDQQNDQNRNEKEEDENKEDKNQDNDQGNQQEQQNQQQNGQQEISREDAERLLNALANDEKNIQEKVKLEKAAKSKVKTLKNW
ncbi:MAG: tetratricopeptide repeat protein [Bacteroidales bacterium]|jgi:tetratricopeptide (TPR) repeat protein|nr:tetratricopeptide repeat protein [Bacteroidales bacterium]